MHTGLSLFTNDPNIKADSEFLNKFQEIMKDTISKLWKNNRYISRFRATYQKTRLNLKKWIHAKASTVNSNPQDQQVRDAVDDTETPVDEPLEENELAVDI